MEDIQHEEICLIEKAKAGGKEAFGHLYDLYFQQIYQYLLIRSGNQADAEDLTETVFLNAWEHLSGFKLRGMKNYFRAWLFKIAHNNLVDHFRAKKDEAILEEEKIQNNKIRQTENQIEKSETDVEIIEAICVLDEVSQQVIFSRFYSGLSHKETALSLGLSEGNVRIIQFRALKKLKNLIGRENE